MPELPEVETMRRGILPVAGCTIADVSVPPCRLKPITIAPAVTHFRRRVRGCRIAAVGRIGKRVTLLLDSSDLIIFEPRMTGLVLLADPPNREHLRFQMRLEGGSGVEQLWYWDRRGLGSVRLMNERERQQLLGPDRLGPDALELTAEQLRERFAASRREVKVALLDQRAVAGVGNLYASEILHVAGVHPQMPCCRLTLEQWQQIHAAMHHVLHEAIRHEGSTLSDGTYRNALNQSGGYQNHHRVYDRAGQVCEGCSSGMVERIVQAQRSTFYCSTCQPRGRRKSLRRAWK